MTPEMAPDGGKHIVQGSGLCARPGRVRNGETAVGIQGISKACDHTGEAKEERRCTLTDQIGPLALRLDPEVRAALLKVSFQAPARHESRMMSSAERHGAVEKRAMGDVCPGDHMSAPGGWGRDRTRAVPQSRAGAHLHSPLSLAIPGHVRSCPLVSGFRRTCSRAGKRWPVTRGRPMVCRVRSGGGSWRTASMRPVVCILTG